MRLGCLKRKCRLFKVLSDVRDKVRSGLYHGKEPCSREVISDDTFGRYHHLMGRLTEDLIKKVPDT